MTYDDDPEEYRKRLEAKLAPDRILSTLAFAGLYQMTHQMITHTVIEDVKGFYGHSPLQKGVWMLGEGQRVAYEREVLALVPGKPFPASLQWLERSGAISSIQLARLDQIYEHRHDLAHELTKYIVDVEFEPDVELLRDAVQIMRDISRFWVQVEKDTGTFDEHGDIAVDDIFPGSLLVLEMCINAYANAPDADEQ